MTRLRFWQRIQRITFWMWHASWRWYTAVPTQSRSSLLRMRVLTIANNIDNMALDRVVDAAIAYRGDNADDWREPYVDDYDEPLPEALVLEALGSAEDLEHIDAILSAAARQDVDAFDAATQYGSQPMRIQ